MLDSFFAMGNGAAAFLSVCAVMIGFVGVAVMAMSNSRHARDLDHAERRSDEISKLTAAQLAARPKR